MICSNCQHEERDGTKCCSECDKAVVRNSPCVARKSSSFDPRAIVFVAVRSLAVLALMGWVINVSEAPIVIHPHKLIAPRSQHVTAAMAAQRQPMTWLPLRKPTLMGTQMLCLV